MNKTDTKILEQKASIYLYTQGTKFICKRFVGAGYAEMDILKVTGSDYMYEYEIKSSKADFLSEKKNFNRKKAKQKYYKHKMMHESFVDKDIKNKRRKTSYIPNKFYFICPEGLIKPKEIRKYQGLIYMDDMYNFKIIKEAKFLHKNKISLKALYRVVKTLSERDMFDGKSKFYYDRC